jgi:hypothetical protein
MATDFTSINLDTFPGIGGAGAMLAGTCQRCGWDDRSEMCQTLVASVPTITNPNYYPCLDLSMDFAWCVERENCVCGGEIPKGCAAIKVEQDACEMEGIDADGGMPEWKTVQTACDFGFSAPADYRERPVQGLDSCLVEFTAGDCEYRGDYGVFSGAVDSTGADDDVRKDATRIDGRDATLVTFHTGGQYVAGVYFPEVQRDTTGVRLSLVGRCWSEAGQSDAQALFRSIHFGS